MYFKKVLFILFLHVTFQSIAQNDTLTNVDCNEGYQQAIKVANGGVFVLPTRGLASYENWAFEEFYFEYLLNNYNIDISGGGCEIDDFTICYDEKMLELVFDEYGDDIFEKSRKEAIKSSNLERSEASYIYDYAEVNIKPIFKNSTDSLFRYISDNIVLKNEPIGVVYTSFIVEIDGTIDEVEFLKGGDTIFHTKLKKVLLGMPKWSPGMVGKDTVRVRFVLPVKFEP